MLTNNAAVNSSVTEKDAIELIKDILSMTSGSIFGNDLQKLATKYVGDDANDKLVFLNAFYPFMKSLPQDLWNNEKSRLTGLETMLAHMENETNKLHPKN